MKRQAEVVFITQKTKDIFWLRLKEYFPGVTFVVTDMLPPIKGEDLKSLPEQFGLPVEPKCKDLKEVPYYKQFDKRKRNT